MRLCLLEPIVFQHGPQQLGLTPDQLEEHLIGVVRDVLIENGSLLKVKSALPIPDQYR